MSYMGKLQFAHCSFFLKSCSGLREWCACKVREWCVSEWKGDAYVGDVWDVSTAIALRLHCAPIALLFQIRCTENGDNFSAIARRLRCIFNPTAVRLHSEYGAFAIIMRSDFTVIALQLCSEYCDCNANAKRFRSNYGVIAQRMRSASRVIEKWIAQRMRSECTANKKRFHSVCIASAQ